jgi:uncharacterized protein YdhG (YjbR/CyaY superfamily)
VPFASVDEYIASFPDDVQDVLRRVRATILEAVPDAGEKISYNIPTMTVGGKNAIYFSGWKNHISLYPVPSGDEDLQAAIAPYKAGKGTLKFPLSDPIPDELISRIARALASRR